jgi:hypothetical protein
MSHSDTLFGDPVRQQSVFWALFLVALNTAVQDSGQVLGLMKRYGPALRTSPVYCCFDTIDILVRLTVGLRKQPLRQVLHRVAATRTMARSAPSEKVRVLWLARWIVTILALTQLVKLASFQGLPWTQAAASAYAAAFAVQEVLNRVGHDDSEIDLKSQQAYKREDEAGKDTFVKLAATKAGENCSGDEDKTPCDPLKERPDTELYSTMGCAVRLLWSRVLPTVGQVILWAWLAGCDRPPGSHGQTAVLVLLTIFRALHIYLMAFAIFPSFIAVVLLLSLAFVLSALPSSFVESAHRSAPGRRLQSVKVCFQEWMPGIFAFTQESVLDSMLLVAFALCVGTEVAIIGLFQIGNALSGFACIPVVPLSDQEQEQAPTLPRISSGLVALAVATMVSYLIFSTLLIMGKLASKINLIKSCNLTTASWCTIHFVLLNFFTASGYYSGSYSEMNTHRPSWTEYLR